MNGLLMLITTLTVAAYILIFIIPGLYFSEIRFIAMNGWIKLPIHSEVAK